MAKKVNKKKAHKKEFVRIKQTFYVDAIIETTEDEDDISIYKRIKEHLKHNGGAETVICQGGDIDFKRLKRKPTEEDEDTYECID